MATNTCAYCHWHCYRDDLEYHVCMLAANRDKKDFTDTCDRFKASRRGHVGCTNPKHSMEIKIERPDM